MGRSHRASKEGLKKLDQAFKIKGKTQDYLAGAVGCTRQTVGKLFAGRPLEKRLFQALCHELNLDWGDIAELESEEDPPGLRNMNTLEKADQILRWQESLSSVAEKPNFKSSKKTYIIITVDGDIENFLNNTEAREAVLMATKSLSGDMSIRTERIEEGSIKITFSGSPQGLKKLEELYNSSNLTEIEGMSIQSVQLFTEEEYKHHLVEEIKVDGARSKNLSDAELSNVDLRGADLRGADLSCADLRNANLENANLENADLNCADLSSTNLSNANLKGVSLHDAIIDGKTKIDDKWHEVWKILNQETFSADLRGANLSRANLSRANLIEANLSRANLIKANLSRANLIKANLSRANLLGADLLGADLIEANLNRANLLGADLLGADLRGADLLGADL